VFLSYELIEGARTHAVGQRAGALGGLILIRDGGK
jgi:hypothetical protein